MTLHVKKTSSLLSVGAIVKKYEMAILPGIRTLYKQDVALACERLEGILSGRVRQGTEPTKCSI